MKQVRQRSRVLRVRKLQHDLAALAATTASDRVRMLEEQQGKLQSVRYDLAAEAGDSNGMKIAGRGELAMRLKAAEIGLGQAIANAKATALSRDVARIEARRVQEAADKLRNKALADRAARELQRSNRLPRMRRTNSEELDA